MPTKQPPGDPLADIVFVKLPPSLRDRLGAFIDPQIPHPFESKNTSEITLEAMLAGMLRILIYQPQHEHALYYSQLVKKLRPNIKEEFTQAGMIKAGQKDFPIAIELFSALKALFPDCPLTRLNLALVYHDAAINTPSKQERQFEAYCEAAFKAYREALEAPEVLPETHLNYGYFLLFLENYEKALAHFEYYLKHAREETNKAKVEKLVNNLTEILSQNLLFQEAFDYISLGQEKRGIAKARELLKKNPEFWNAWFLLGWGLRRLARYAEAKEAFLKALSLTEPKPDLLNELAITHLELGELEASYQRLNQALKLEPANTKIISNLGIVCLKRGQVEEAKVFFKTVLEYEPTNPLAEQFLKELS